MDDAVAQGRADGYSDLDIASAMGLAHFWTRPKRVLISVSYVRFKGQSSEPAEDLDAAFEYASTAPWVRRAEAAEAEAEALASQEVANEEFVESDEEEAVEDVVESEEGEAEDEEPRRRRWLDWIPGL